jgi:hypothetical protein
VEQANCDREPSTDCQPLRTVNRFEKASSASQQAMCAGPFELPRTRNKKTGTAANRATRCALLLRFQQGQRMRIYHLFRDAPFDADHIELMSSAFEDVSKQLGLGRREDAIRDIVATAILECAQRGSATPSRCANARATSYRLRKRRVGRRSHDAHLRQRNLDFVARSNQNGGTALMLSQS